MLITRRAAMRREKTVELVNELAAPSFSSTRRQVDCTFHGEDRGNRYRYVLYLDPTEILAMLDVAVSKQTSTPAELAVAKGALATLEHLLTAGRSAS